MQYIEKAHKESNKQNRQFFEDLKSQVLSIDPLSFCENFLKVNGEPFDFSSGSWKPIGDVYRHIIFNACSQKGKPVVIVKGRQVGATIMSTALELFLTTSGAFGSTGENSTPIRIAHCFPDLQFVDKFAKTQLAPMLNNDHVIGKLVSMHGVQDTQTFKQFEHGTLKVESVGINARRLQGSTLDVIFFDEVQHMSQDEIGNATKTLTHAKYGKTTQGVQVYFGTPLQTGTYFSTMWESSDIHYWHFHCPECDHWFPIYTLGCGDAWEKIWVYDYTIKCPSCGNLQDKRVAAKDGKWKSVSENPDSCQMMGFHLNQLMIPIFSKDAILAKKPSPHNPIASEKEWMNEVLGEFYSGMGVGLTRDDIYNNCRDVDRGFLRFIPPKAKKVYMGIDWGGKTDSSNISSGQSYSTLVVISVEHAHMINIEYCYKFPTDDFVRKMKIVEDMYHRYNIDIAVADFFYGNDICNELQKIYSTKFISAVGSGNAARSLSYKEDLWQITYNKDMMVEKIFDMCRRGQVRFPWLSFESLNWLIDHCTSMEVKDREINGIKRKKYVKGSKPNDGLMSLMYAIIAWEFDRTAGFKVDPRLPGFDTKQHRAYPVSLAYAPKMK